MASSIVTIKNSDIRRSSFSVLTAVTSFWTRKAEKSSNEDPLEFMSQDLRTFLDQVKRANPEDFLTISREVDPAFEITATTVKLEQEAKRRPIILFEKVKGTKFPVLTNLHAGRPRL